jgi:hypothetical protein
MGPTLREQGRSSCTMSKVRASTQFRSRYRHLRRCCSVQRDRHRPVELTKLQMPSDYRPTPMNCPVDD